SLTLYVTLGSPPNCLVMCWFSYLGSSLQQQPHTLSLHGLINVKPSRTIAAVRGSLGLMLPAAPPDAPPAAPPPAEPPRPVAAPPAPALPAAPRLAPPCPAA